MTLIKNYKIGANFKNKLYFKKSVSSRIKHIDFDKAFETRYYSFDKMAILGIYFFRKYMEIHVYI